MNAIKLFVRIRADILLDPELIHRPKRAKVLPNILSKQEIKLILSASKNIKHKAMFCLIYSCGFRRSELLNLRLEHVDSGRKLLIIKQSKGKKKELFPFRIRSFFNYKIITGYTSQKYGYLKDRMPEKNIMIVVWTRFSNKH